MSNSLTRLPIEVVGLIVDHLDLCDIRALRNACRDVSAKVTGSRRFQYFCSKKEVELRVSSLEQLAAKLSKPASVESSLEHLTITGVQGVTTKLEHSIQEKTKRVNVEEFGKWARETTGRLVRRESSKVVPAIHAESNEAKARLSHFEWPLPEGDEEEATRKDRGALVALFNVIRICCRLKGLASLTLDVSHREESDGVGLPPSITCASRPCWKIAERVFSTSLQAWKHSSIRIEHLDVFTKTSDGSLRDYGMGILQDTIEFSTLHGLKALSLSISSGFPASRSLGQIQGHDEGEEQDDEQEYNTPGYFGELATWLQQSPDLEELNIHNHERFTHESEGSVPCTDRGGRMIIKHMAESVPLPRLKKLTLSGATVDFISFMTILRKLPDLESISLHEMTVLTSRARTWETIFAHLTSPSSRLTSIHLDNLFEESEQERNYIACFSPGTKPGDSIGSGERVKARLERLKLDHITW